jgi:hypothetical protein
MSLDRFVDTARLRSLDAFIASRIRLHVDSGQDSFFLNQHRLDQGSAYRPGVREIWLSRLTEGTPYDYLDLDKPGVWESSAAAEEFAPVMDFIATLPFAATARIIIIYDHEGNAVPAHRDHEDREICNEFIWMRTNSAKRFYLLNPENREKLYVDSHTAWFDTVNQYHGADANDGLSFSLRVDGVFTDEFRRKIPFPREQRSAAPSLWAAEKAARALQPAMASAGNLG